MPEVKCVCYERKACCTCDPTNESWYEPPEPSRTLEALKAACSFAGNVLVGIRTLGTAALFLLAGFADQYDLIDIIGWVRAAMGDSAKVGSVVIVVAACFFILKLFSRSGPVRGKGAKGVDEGA